MSDYYPFRGGQNRQRQGWSPPPSSPSIEGTTDETAPAVGSKHATEPVTRAPETMPTYIPHNRFTLTVDDVVAEFARNGFIVPPRTIQRWCQTSKLSSIKVDKETLLPTDREPWKLLIDATSVATRIATERDNPDCVLKTTGTTGRIPDAAERDADATPKSVDALASQREREGDDGLRTRIKDLESENVMLKIDNSAREQIIAQVKDDRKELIEQLQGFVDKIADQSLRIGQLQEQLTQLEAPKHHSGPDASESQAPPQQGVGDKYQPSDRRFGV